MTQTRGAIAAGHRKTAEAGMEILAQGGNAFDAVVAAALAACVAEYALISLGGGGFLLAHTSDHHNTLFDFFTQTPQQRNTLHPDFYPVDVNFGSVIQEFHIGLGSAAVPGVAKGLLHVHKKLGRLPLATVAAPAIHYARTGVEMTPFQCYSFSILTPILAACPEMGPILVPNGKGLQPGDILRIPALADTLEFLVAEGARGFYEGEPAQQLVRACQEKGGFLTLADLKDYAVIERSPLVADYRGNTLLTNPPPSSGGTLIAFALGLLSQIDLAAMPFGSLEHLTTLAQVMRLTNQARADGYDRQLYAPDVAERFLSPNHLHTYARALTGSVNKWGSTTHISVIDGEGNAASLTGSNGEGCGYSIPGTGVMLNNMLGEEDLHPTGFHQWQENVRISSMMSPTIVLRDRQPELVLGSGGSNRIRTAILQVMSNLVDFGMKVEAAVESPRIHWENGVFSLEPGFGLELEPLSDFPFDQEVNAWAASNMFFGGVHAVSQAPDGTLEAAGDSRRDGAIALL
ncbi:MULTISPECIES: gamma-glutamyltransferase [unclassified Leptolyngbya]|uniref:gamma-glutamyltransferase n=1 Tax=unclassified Leptolyngbya TaxID=2650499 RepID=UPI0016860D27|nr:MULTISPECIES: gamma-glutamyltransferase [unclassified Leptolyngbya]MBD1912392.1 gamma-glutamyltransferase [Leptolyngbya sp. FACHB-8]MBD2157973.1 gamma-glutamyltransferase [Leptolyngbya sp. FACHB-16]